MLAKMSMLLKRPLRTARVVTLEIAHVLMNKSDLLCKYREEAKRAKMERRQPIVRKETFPLPNKREGPYFYC